MSSVSVSLRTLTAETASDRRYGFMYIGTPSLDEFYAITSRRSRDYIRALPIRKKRAFPTLFPQASPEAIDFLSKTLVSPQRKTQLSSLAYPNNRLSILRRG